MRLLFQAIRLTGGALPPAALVALLWPWALFRAAIDVWVRGRRPPSHLPPLPGRTRRAHEALMDRLAFRLTPLVGFWADRTTSSQWAARYDLSELERIRPILDDRPVLLVSLHYGALVMVPSLLCMHGVPAALAVGPDNWPLSRLRQWRLDLAKVGDAPTAVPAQALPMLRFLRKPNRCLLVAVDVPAPEASHIEFQGGLMRVATPPFRLARMTGARVVPVLAIHEGAWRIRVRFGEPVPDDLIASESYDAAAAHIVDQLMPLAAAAPGQALPSLVEAFVRLPAMSETPSAIASSTA